MMYYVCVVILVGRIQYWGGAVTGSLVPAAAVDDECAASRIKCDEHMIAFDYFSNLHNI